MSRQLRAAPCAVATTAAVYGRSADGLIQSSWCWRWRALFVKMSKDKKRAVLLGALTPTQRQGLLCATQLHVFKKSSSTLPSSPNEKKQNRTVCPRHRGYGITVGCTCSVSSAPFHLSSLTHQDDVGSKHVVYLFTHVFCMVFWSKIEWLPAEYQTSTSAISAIYVILPSIAGQNKIFLGNGDEVFHQPRWR